MKFIVRKLLDIFFQNIDAQRRQLRYEFLIDKGWLVMGKHSYGQPTVHLYRGSEARVIIGSYSSISPEVTFITGGIHPLNWISTYPFRARWNLKNAFQDGMPFTKGDITVGSDVWIGTDVMILSGVQIGDGAIIAARAVVSKDVPAYAIAAGVPAKVIGYRFEKDIINKLLEIKWWDWDEEKVKATVALLSSPDIEDFLAAQINRAS